MARRAKNVATRNKVATVRAHSETAARPAGTRPPPPTDDIFGSLSPEALGSIAQYLRWDPTVANTHPSKPVEVLQMPTGKRQLAPPRRVVFLSHLPVPEQLNWLAEHRAELAHEICAVGSHTLWKKKTYSEVVLDLAKRVGVTSPRTATTPQIEQSIQRRFVEDAWAKLTPEQRAKIEQIAASHGKSLTTEVAGFSALAAAQLSGFGVYVLSSTLLGAVNGAFGLGLGFGVFAGLSELISVVIGPFGWAALGLVAVAKLGAPNYKKLLPVIVVIALERQRLRDPAIKPSAILPFRRGRESVLAQSHVTAKDSYFVPEEPPTVGSESEYDLIAQEYGQTAYRSLSEPQKVLIRQICSQRLEIERPSVYHPAGQEATVDATELTEPRKPKNITKQVVVLRQGDTLSKITTSELQELSKHYRSCFPRLEFDQEALKELCRMNVERAHLVKQFGDINRGQARAKRSIPYTDPRVWELEGSGEERVYFRQIAAEKWMIELVGRRSSRARDYRRLRKKSRLEVQAAGNY